MPEEGAPSLVARCATQRDHRTWGEFLARYRAPLAAGLRRGLHRAGTRPGGDEVEDLLQEVYCRLLDKEARSLARFRGCAEREVWSYLGRIAESVVLDRLRAEAAAKRGRARTVEPPEGERDGFVERAADPGLSPEDALLAKERRRLFLSRCRRAVGPKSPGRDLRVLELALVEGWSSREICAGLGEGLRPSTVDSLVHRVKRRLAAQGVRIPRRCS